MSKIRSKDMKPELAVRKLVHSLGYRYRLHYANLPGKPDLVFPGKKKIIFVHGCFWHQHDDPNCPDGARRKPKTNNGYWNPKLQKNVERDLRNVRQLKQDGWDIFTVWECQTAKLPELSAKLQKFLKN